MRLQSGPVLEIGIENPPGRRSSEKEAIRDGKLANQPYVAGRVAAGPGGDVADDAGEKRLDVGADEFRPFQRPLIVPPAFLCQVF